MPRPVSSLYSFETAVGIHRYCEVSVDISVGASFVISTISSDPHEIWYSRCPTPTTLGLAFRLGLLEQHAGNAKGLQWRALQDSPDPAVQRSHFTHAKARCVRHGGNVPPIWARAEGARTRLIGLSWLPTPQPILTLPETGIRTAEDLRGKRLLVMTRPESEIDFWQAVTLRVYEAALASAGLSFSDIELVRVPSARPDAVRVEISSNDPQSLWPLRAMSAINRETMLPLIRGEVDAVVSQGHNAMQLTALLDGRIIYDQCKGPDLLHRVNNDAPDALTVSEDLLETDFDLVVDILSALIEAQMWAGLNVSRVASTLAPELNISEQLMRVAYGNTVADGMTIGLDRDHLAAIGAQKAFLRRHGFITTDFDLDQWVDRRPLEAALKKQSMKKDTRSVASPHLERSPI